MSHAVMVVDDDEDLRCTVMEILEDHGFVAMGAENGAAALQALRNSANRPCLIFLDLMMPVLDGQGFREEQLRDPSLASIPVVVISAYRDADIRAQGMSPAALLQKPMTPEVLISAARRFC